MANDVSYFKILGDSTQYSFNDADAETSITTLNSNKVSKAGDTMTGALNVSNNERIGIYDTDITVGTVPNTNHYGSGIRFYDNTSSSRVLIGVVQPVYFTDGSVGIQIGGRDATHQNNLRLAVDANGNPLVAVSSAAAWRSALGVPATSDMFYAAGDSVTITGATQCAGVWVNATTLRFQIPLMKSAAGRSVAITSGGFLLRCNGTNTTVGSIDSSMTATCEVTPSGIKVEIVYASAPSYAQANYPVTVQPNGLTLRFS